MLMNISKDALITRQAELDIKKSSEWNEIEQQLSEDEKDVFLHHWRELVAQFNNDVTHTERLQIMDVIRNEILISRCLKRINRANQKIEDCHREYMKERSLDLSIQVPNKLVDLQRQSADELIAVGQYNKEYQELSKRKNETLKDIKGTREQRVKRLEESKETITGWITTIMTEPKMRDELGRWVEKFRIAQVVEYQRLGEYHTYEDGSIEQPILNNETIKDDNI